ncbi:hypothetical protein BDF21DRAFT_408839 [Thamnidium elegans]|nr:hypothetical protein BDF21DRAFT_408839 [Thamnidium elegans]
MSSSPSTERTSSPSATTSRYSERYKALLTESPPRESLPKPAEKPNKTNETKIFNGEKYSAYEIKNEDRGEWRQSTTSVTKEVEQVEVKEPTNSIPSPQVVTEKKRSVPGYMQSTSSFSNKLLPSKEKRNVLGPRSRGGINKRVGTSKVPRYQSTTSINAIEDIQSEMSSDDKYVSMAARIKLFEKGLGNGSNKRVPVTPRQSSSTSTISSQGTPVPVKRNLAPETKPSSATPSYLRKTVASETKSTKRKRL